MSTMPQIPQSSPLEYAPQLLGAILPGFAGGPWAANFLMPLLSTIINNARGDQTNQYNQELITGQIENVDDLTAELAGISSGYTNMMNDYANTLGGAFRDNIWQGTADVLGVDMPSRSSNYTPPPTPQQSGFLDVNLGGGEQAQGYAPNESASGLDSLNFDYGWLPEDVRRESEQRRWLVGPESLAGKLKGYSWGDLDRDLFEKYAEYVPDLPAGATVTGNGVVSGGAQAYSDQALDGAVQEFLQPFYDRDAEIQAALPEWFQGITGNYEAGMDLLGKLGGARRTQIDEMTQGARSRVNQSAVDRGIVGSSVQENLMQGADREGDEALAELEETLAGMRFDFGNQLGREFRDRLAGAYAGDTNAMQWTGTNVLNNWQGDLANQLNAVGSGLDMQTNLAMQLLASGPAWQNPGGPAQQSAQNRWMMDEFAKANESNWFQDYVAPIAAPLAGGFAGGFGGGFGQGLAAGMFK